MGPPRQGGHPQNSSSQEGVTQKITGGSSSVLMFRALIKDSREIPSGVGSVRSLAQCSSKLSAGGAGKMREKTSKFKTGKYDLSPVFGDTPTLRNVYWG